MKRRAILKNGAALTGSTLALTNSAWAHEEARQYSTGFDPSNLSEVSTFTEEILGDRGPFQALEDWHDGKDAAVFKRLTEEQVRAVFHGLFNWTIVEEESKIGTLSTEKTVSVAGDTNPFEEFGWDPEVAMHSHPDNSGYSDTAQVKQRVQPSDVESTDYSDTITAAAVSIDFEAYRWRATLFWTYDDNKAWDPQGESTVLNTAYHTYHQNTQKDTVDRRDDVFASFTATFKNEVAKVCDPWGVVCIDLGQSFHPSMELEGDEHGNGNTAAKDNASLGP